MTFRVLIVAALCIAASLAQTPCEKDVKILYERNAELEKRVELLEAKYLNGEFYRLFLI